MKYSQLKAFDRHIQEAAPHHLCETYLLIDPEPYAQRKWAQKLSSYSDETEFISLSECTKSDVLRSIETQSLFAQKRQCVFLNAESATKAQQEALLKVVSAPHPHLRLVLCACNSTAFLQKLLKHVVALDLSLEKPWDKEERLVLYVREAFYRSSISVSASLALQVVKMCNFKLALIDPEIEKLTCYLKDQKELKREDLSLLKPQLEHHLFKMAEAVLEGKTKEALYMMEQNQFHLLPFIYALRSLFQKGLRLKEVSLEKAEELFPKMKGKWLEKQRMQIARHSKVTLQKALLTLFELEVLFKNQSVDESFLQSMCIFKLGALK